MLSQELCKKLLHDSLFAKSFYALWNILKCGLLVVTSGQECNQSWGVFSTCEASTKMHLCDITSHRAKKRCFRLQASATHNGPDHDFFSGPSLFFLFHINVP